jgi:hypothetical protein
MDKHKKKIKQLKHSTALEFNLPDEKVDDVINSMFKFIREKTRELNLKEVKTQEELDKLKTTFIIQKLGRLYVEDEALLKRNNKQK